MPQEQYPHRSTMHTSEGPQVYKVGIYGWRKRCLYFFVLLLMILILVNLAMTIWILKVMNFTIDGMGNLRITEKGLKLEGDSEFLKPLYAKEIRSRPGNPLYFQSARNVTVNILNEKTKVLTRLVTGPQAVEAHSQKFEVKTLSGKLLFSADDNEVVVGAERLRVLGAEGTVFPKSIETPNVRADPFKELRLESPTRALVMEAPKGIEINAEAGSLKATCRTELRLESKDGEGPGKKSTSSVCVPTGGCSCRRRAAAPPARSTPASASEGQLQRGVAGSTKASSGLTDPAANYFY
ncbi:PREDICTED: delta-sarcoglycan isoform X1 [Ficedula albicollis]|uniref:delta-sarcoglycan isoform X1 n=1 Tax=Ficedula albicollis TaxID=59894 RepID=UPI000359D748|nr:PREDICTED: delta-sarcoglycan isoform X1 [Ficedula albicollis]XP_016157180.1 PREDICTED: delta-sarcoglycan isoform X1 [Ficedula albicollis]